jgi:hypothetical protein
MNFMLQWIIGHYICWEYGQYEGEKQSEQNFGGETSLKTVTYKTEEMRAKY